MTKNSIDFRGLLLEFIELIRSGRVEVYNEFSLQHELGVHLRNSLGGLKVQFERNVGYFFKNRSEFIKREIDISVFNDVDQSLEWAIELKYPRNGQHPEQMFSFCKDIAFVEQLKTAGFKQGFVVIFADDPLFYRGGDVGIYAYFRAGAELSGVVQKPTGKRDTAISISGRYQVCWEPILNDLKYTLIEAQAA